MSRGIEASAFLVITNRGEGDTARFSEDRDEWFFPRFGKLSEWVVPFLAIIQINYHRGIGFQFLGQCKCLAQCWATEAGRKFDVDEKWLGSA